MYRIYSSRTAQENVPLDQSLLKAAIKLYYKAFIATSEVRKPRGTTLA